MVKFRVVFILLLLLPLAIPLPVESVDRQIVPEDAVSFYNTLIGSDWKLFRNPGDDQLYYSVAGGLAGLGLRLLDLGSTDSLSLAEAVAQDLLGFASVDNSTHIMWTVNDNSSTVDLGYDFGLSGIAAFYSNLAILTNSSTYTTIAQRTLTSINSLANGTTSIYWQANLTYLDGNYWYATDYYTSAMDHAIYTGKAFGPVGLGYATLLYASAPGSNTTFAETLLDRVNAFLDDSSTDVIGHSTLPIILGETTVSNSRAFGMSGIGEYYFNYLNYKNTTTIQQRLDNVRSWMFSSQNLFGNLYKDGIQLNSYWTGLELGVAGNLRFLSLMYSQLNTTEKNMLEDLSNRISLLRQSFDGGLGFPEYVNNNKPVDVSHSRSYGTPGIVETLLTYGEITNVTKEMNRLDLYRNSILNSIANYTAGLYYPIVGDYGHGSAVGLAGVLKLFTIEASPLLTVSTEAVNFGLQEIGETYTQDIVLSNVGIVTADVQINSTAPFLTNETHFSISSGHSKVLEVSFSPNNESSLSSAIIIIVNNESIIPISVSGQGYDYPSVTIQSSTNNSVISATENFKFLITDSSPLKSVRLTIFDGSTEILTVTLNPSLTGSIYEYSWDTLTVGNGNYTVKIHVEDIHDRSSDISYHFSVANPVRKPSDFLFTGTFLYTTIAVIVVLLAIVSYQLISTIRKS